MLQIQIGDIIDNQYEIIKKLSQGSFGIVFYGKSIKTKKSVAIKVEKQEMAGFGSLFREVDMLSKLKGVPQIPELLWYGEFKKCNIMITKMLGHDLIYHQKQYKQFSSQCINSIAYQLLWILEQIHKQNIIHRDIKPENILSKNESDKIYLIDFGISKNTDSNFIHKKKLLPFIGTSRYASISAHQGIEQTPKDDLESLGYVLIYLTTQHLPWMNIEKADVQRLDKIGKLKENVLLEDLCFGCPNSMLKYMRYVKDLKPNSKPKYGILRGLFLSKLQNTIELGLDWTNQIIKIEKKKHHKKQRNSCDLNFKSCVTIRKPFMGETQINLNVKTIAVQDEQLISSDNGTNSQIQFSIIETLGSKNSVKVGFSASDNLDCLCIQQNNNMARISTFEGIAEVNSLKSQSFEQQLMESEHQDLEIKCNVLHFNSVYFNFKNPIQQHIIKQNYQVKVIKSIN
ncbi:unnamed protein product [Paramecium pentaurelia]|uniref:Casein kinase I n=1 Tax=Paramecium pentaurelia TaxID=43138 RepID=A0A8S1XCH9_9CILI|nr:unnamed protein product [Paramecium pentaurelia]